MVDICQSVVIQAPVDRVFAVVVDLAHYSRWLPQSTAFKGITHISDAPIRQGTTYAEESPAGVRHGEITELQEPTRVTFHQPMALNPQLLGLVIDITVTITLTSEDSGTHLDRIVSLKFPWLLTPLQPILVPQFESEIARTLQKLRTYIESQA